MTEFACSVCQYTSTKRDHVERHVNKKKSCGPGIKEIIEIPIEINCEFCGKNFSTQKTLIFHLKKTCKEKTNILVLKIKELENKLKEKTKIEKTTEDEDEDYIYLIKIYPYTDNIYKVGRTENILKRLSDYKRYKIVFIITCKNAVTCENDLIKLYKIGAVECKEMGNEYFYGEYQNMKKIIRSYFSSSVD
jgi:hypothetical protein